LSRDEGDKMPEFRVVTVNKARALIREEKTKSREGRKKSAIVLEYEKYLMNLERGKAIGIALDDGDNVQTIKYRLRNAAKSLGIRNLKIERAGNSVVVYREVKSRTRKAKQSSVEASPVREVVGEELADGREEEECCEPESAVGEESPAFEAPVEGDAGERPSGDSEDPSEDAAPEPSPAGRRGEAMLEFDEEWREPMIREHKTCEACAERHPGLSFEAFGDEYAITKVEYLPLGEIAEKWFKEHGFYSPREFREVWKEKHGGVFDPEQKVSLHHFRKAFEAPPRPDSAGYPE